MAQKHICFLSEKHEQKRRWVISAESRKKIHSIIKLGEDRKWQMEITLDNPPVNALSGKALADLSEEIFWARRQNYIEKIVIKGSGNYFSAGADLNELKEISNPPNAISLAMDFSEKGHQLIRDILNFPRPVVAFIDGYALGGGMELALACEYIVATKRSFLGLPEVTLGIIPGWGGTVLLPRKIKDPQKGIEFIREARIFSAEEALNLGLINELDKVDGDKLKRPVVGSPHSFARHILGEVAGFMCRDEHSEDKLFTFEKYLFGLTFAQPDAKERISAFLETRQPKFL